MLLHTRLINIFSSNHSVARIEVREIDNRMPPVNLPKVVILYEGAVDVNQCVSVVEHEIDRLESIGFEPNVSIHLNNKVDVIHKPTEGVRKSYQYEIDIYL
ncbi:hypothetical protein A6P54_12280 [Bacillus sp. MKU004]|nr:hypothetical protein A6P54_12280 [Bacillus sp. MKU004]